MVMVMRNGWRALAGALLVGLAFGAGAQAYPTKPVQIIISHPPGGSTDILARQLAQKLQEGLAQPVVVTNRPGGNFVIAAEAAAAAPADGYTLFMAVDSTFTLNPILYPKLSYSLERDFAPISLVAVQSLFLVASPKSPVKSFAELIGYAKANPGKVSFGSSVLVGQLVGEQIKIETGIDMVHVPFKGSPPMLQALLAGDIDFAIAGILPYATFAKDGKLRGLATTGDKREGPLPETPTLAELGYPAIGYRAWFGLFAPAATPKPILARLHAEVGKVLSDAETRQRMVASGLEPAASSPGELNARVRTDLAKWTRIIKAAGIKLE